ncbi:MAG: hypothetical protein KatS3mg082_2892 [Nitrospiraceae bacterium]|nr:MAG: hypothetical protein KatS3mg082_2892 [Nitrospiraceae bacterium]
MLQITPHMRLLVAVEPADFRKGIDGLARLCKDVLDEDPLEGAVFVFRNRRGSLLGLEKPDSGSGRTRTGTFTSTVVARREGIDAALFFSGHRHAGENLAAVLRDHSLARCGRTGSLASASCWYLSTRWRVVGVFMNALAVGKNWLRRSRWAMRCRGT